MYAVKVYEAYITTRLKEKRIIMNKKYLPRELALCIVRIINSLGVCLMAKSGFGISTISSVPFVFNKVFPALSFGTWNYIFQTMLVLTLMILKKAFCFEYIFSFVVGIGTVLCAFITGKTVSMFQKVLDDHVVFYRAVIRPTKPEISGRTV